MGFGAATPFAPIRRRYASPYVSPPYAFRNQTATVRQASPARVATIGPLSESAGRVEQMFSGGGFARKSWEAVADVALATDAATARHVAGVLRAELLDLERAQDGDHGFGLDRLQSRIGEDRQLGIDNGRGADGQPSQVA